MTDFPQGRLLVGKFSGVKQVSKKDGTLVPGMFEVSVTPEGRDWPLRAVFFATDEDGEPSRMQKTLDAAKPAEGSIVAVRFTTKATVSGSDGKAYANDTAAGLYVLDAARVPVKA